jgi:hypothetical protein
VIKFFIDNWATIKSVAMGILNSIGMVALNKIDSAVGFVENILAKGMKLIIDFLARIFGLSGIADKVKTLIKKISDPVQAAIGKVIDWIIEQGKKLLGIGDKEQKKGGKYDGQVGKVVNFTAAKESHRLWIVLRGKDAVVMMASTEKPVTEQLGDYEKMAQQLQDKGKKAKVAGLIGKARQALSELDSKADQLAADAVKPEVKPEQVAVEDDVVENKEDQLVTLLKQIRELLGIVDFKEVKETLEQAIRKLISNKSNGTNNTRDVKDHFSEIRSKYHLDEIKWKNLGQPIVSIEFRQKQTTDSFDDRSILKELNLSESDSTNVKLENKGIIKHTPQTIKIPHGSHPVGQEMEAILTSNPISETPGTSQLNEVMRYLPTAIKKYAKEAKFSNIGKQQFSSSLQYVAGHLLNHRLGGKNEAQNLYPITQEANKEHEKRVESKVKDWTKNGKYFLRYTVSVKNKDEDIKLNENPKIGPNEPKGNMVVNAEFECKVVVYTATGSDTQDGNKRIEEKISSKFSQT